LRGSKKQRRLSFSTRCGPCQLVQTFAGAAFPRIRPEVDHDDNPSKTRRCLPDLPRMIDLRA
jgi:hypothetical protein